jgi:hypothetical protein
MPLVVACACLFGMAGQACGAEDEVAPYTPPPPPCREADDYLQTLYAVVDAGQAQALASTVRDRLPESARRDVVDGVLRLLTAFQEGSVSALATLPADQDSNVQRTLGRVLRWLVRDSPAAPHPGVFGVVRTILGTCDGPPILGLLAETVADFELVSALADTLAGADLGDSLAALDFEGQSGREATQYLVRNLLASAASDSFDVQGLLGLLGLLVDLNAPPYAELSAGILRVLDPDGLLRLQNFLVCVRAADPGLALGGFLYDVLTSGLLTDLAAPGAVDVGGALNAPTLRVASEALAFLASDAIARRDFLPALLLFLADDVAPSVLSDLASLLEAEAFSGVIELLADLASGVCRLPGGTP